MIALLIFLVRLLVLPSKPKRRLEAENAALRRQLAILQCKVRGRVRLTNSDRLFFVLLYRWFPSILKTVTVIQPETLVRWHRAGFRRYWRWKSGNSPTPDRPGVQIAAVCNHASTNELVHQVEQAEFVYAETPEQTFALMRDGSELSPVVVLRTRRHLPAFRLLLPEKLPACACVAPNRRP